MERHFDEELKVLKERVLYMGSLVEAMIQLAIKELEDRKPDLVSEVIKREQEVNQLQLDIDEHCLKLLALYQPAAVDLRFVTAAMKIISDLERIGDQAVNISETSQILLEQPQLRERLFHIPRMAQVAMAMVKESLDAFVNRDVKMAERVLEEDDEEDDLKSQTFNELLALMKKDASIVHQCLDLILISRNLERVGDHATNIAEDVIFMVLGKDIRHHKEEPKN